MSLFAKTTTESFISVAAASKNKKGTIARFRCSGGLINSSTMSSLAFSGAPVQWRLFRKSSRKRKEPLKGCNLACLNRTMDIRAEVNYVSPKEAKRLITEEGYTILDVRDKTQFDRAHIKSCYHVPIFIENNDGDFSTVIKRTLHNNVSGLFFGLPFTKSNSDFVPLVQQQFPLDSKLLLVCQEGLRSNLAAKKLEEAGYQNLSSITSGLQSVEPGTFETNGSKELQDAGKAGLITIQGKISAVLGTFLIAAFLFITFFPDQAEKLLQVNLGTESSLQ